MVWFPPFHNPRDVALRVFEESEDRATGALERFQQDLLFSSTQCTV
jgi:hypothetical protein